MSPADALEAGLADRVARELSLLRPTRLTIGSVAWGSGPDAAEMWIPDETVPLWGTPEYASLTAEQKRRYNHYYALQKAESFVWTEQNLIIVPLERLLRAAIPPSLRALIDSFVADERHHVAAISRLLRLARPDLYGERISCFFRPPLKFRLVTALMTAFPRLLSSWCLLICVLEENTITFAQLYRQAGDKVDRLFAEVYALHAQDEGRHCKLDALFCEWLLAGGAGWRRWINARLLTQAFAAYFDTGWGLDAPIRHLVADFPELRVREPALLRRTLETRSPVLAQQLIDRGNAPISSRMAEKFGMLADAIRRVAASH